MSCRCVEPWRVAAATMERAACQPQKCDQNLNRGEREIQQCNLDNLKRGQNEGPSREWKAKTLQRPLMECAQSYAYSSHQDDSAKTPILGSAIPYANTLLTHSYYEAHLWPETALYGRSNSLYVSWGCQTKRCWENKAILERVLSARDVDLLTSPSHSLPLCRSCEM